MRLICPNCDAQYEVPTEVVPTEGRDVQCSNCGQTWFQHHPDHMPEVDQQPEPIVDAHEDHTEAEPKRREMDPSVADILQQEAAHETKLRDQEAGGLETQPELGLSESDDRSARSANDARERMARMRGQDSATGTTAADAAVGSRRDLLPDIEEINSTLRSTSDRQIAGNDTSATPPARARSKRGFRRGFIYIVLIAVLLAALYVFAPAISKALPKSEPYLATYIGWVDQGRGWLDGQVQSLLKWLDATAASQNGG